MQVQRDVGGYFYSLLSPPGKEWKWGGENETKKNDEEGETETERKRIKREYI